MNIKNRLPATITGVKRGKLNAHVSLEWESQTLSVVITSTSADEMALEKGDIVDVLFKASDVIVAKGLQGKISARNILSGTITEVREGFPLALVTIDSKGTMLSAELTASSLSDMGLHVGDEVEAVIKSSELILAKIR